MVDAPTYHERTKHHPDEVPGSSEAMDPALRPRPWKEYRDLDRLSLPAIRPVQQPTLPLVAERNADPRSDGSESSALDRELVATLCHAASGITQEVETDRGDVIHFRASSCTGKLYHIELYLAVGDLDGLSAGLYHFDPRSMALTVLREGDVRHAISEAVGGDTTEQSSSRDVPLFAIATSHWWRNAWKYTERTYRHAFWDGGTVVSNLLAAAHAHDLPATAVTGFADEPIASLLGVDPDTEAPVAVVPIGDGEPIASAGAIDPIDPAVEPVSSDTIEYPLIADAWRQSTLPSADAAHQWRSSARAFDERGPIEEGDTRVPLDPVGQRTASARPLHATIRRRGSCREYADRGPSRRMVGTVLDRALGGVPGDWNGGRADGLATVEPYVLTTGVEDVPDGTYRYDPDEAALARIGPCDRETTTHLALDQPWAGEAHVNVYLMTDIDAIVDQLGNRGYRLAQFEAGITMGRLYLATYAHRALGGTGLTFYDDVVTEHLGPGSGTPMCLFAFGRASN